MASERPELHVFLVPLRMNTSDASEISDDEQSVATLDPALDAQLIDLFNSDMEDEDFDGF